MALNYINDFQTSLYRQLTEDEGISSMVDKIYLSIKQDAKYPFLLISILKAQDLSQTIASTNYKMYQIEFEIAVFTRDKNQGILTNIADKINSNLTAKNARVADYIVAGIKTSDLAFSSANDLLTSKLALTYHALLKQII